MGAESDSAGWELRTPPGGHATGKAPTTGEMKRRRRNLSLNRPDDTSVTGGQGLCLNPVEPLVARWPVRMLSQTASHKQAFTHQCDSAGRRREKGRDTPGESQMTCRQGRGHLTARSPEDSPAFVWTWVWKVLSQSGESAPAKVKDAGRRPPCRAGAGRVAMGRVAGGGGSPSLGCGLPVGPTPPPHPVSWPLRAGDRTQGARAQPDSAAPSPATHLLLQCS